MFPIIKRELEDIVFNKRYMAGFVVQLLLLMVIIPIFSSQLAESNPGLLTPDVKEFIPIGVIPVSKKSDILMQELMEEEKLDITFFDYNPMDKLKSGEISALVVIPSGYDEEAMEELPVWFVVSSSNPKRESVSDVLITLFERTSKKISEERKARLGIEIKEPITIERQLLKPPVMEKGGTRFSSFFMGYLIPIVLFFPIFMSGGLIIDAVVGEKEKKTMEALLSLPIKRGWIVVGKLVGIYGWISLQCFLWLLILKFFGIPLANLWLVLLFLLFTNLAVISTAFVLATYSSATKEANVSLMLFYVFVFMALIVSLSLEFFNPRGFYDFIPFNIISSLSVGDALNPLALFFVPAVLGGYSLFMIRISTGLIERDDIVFGPRPSVWDLFGYGIEGMLQRFEGHPVAGRALISTLSGALAMPISAVLEISVGVTALYFLGYSYFTLTMLVVIFALLEELLKPIALFPAKVERTPSMAAYGGLAGLSFFFFESIFIALILSFSIPLSIYRIITLRMGTTLLIHVVSSAIVGSGISKGKGKFALYLLLATVLHAAYNMGILRAML